MTMITPSYLGETIEYSSLHACRSTLEDPTRKVPPAIVLTDPLPEPPIRAGAIANAEVAMLAKWNAPSRTKPI